MLSPLGLIATMARRHRSSSTTTVEEANKEHGISRSSLWAWSVFLQLLFFGLALGLGCVLYRLKVARSLPRLLAAVSWLPYASLSHAMVGYVNLSLPLAPVAALDALVAVAGIGTFLGMIFVAFPVVVYGHTAAFVALACVLAVVLAGLVAWWVWLDRTYRAVGYLPR